jgi:energy-coupling factor transport system ATP-binding protein
VDARGAVLARNMGVSHLLSRTVHELSAGEATLVALAAALISEPTVLLIDEPFADLDEISLDRVAGLLCTLALKTGMTIVVAEHRITPLAPLAQARLHIAHGTIRLVDVSEQVSECDRMSDEMSVARGIELPVAAIVGPNGSGKTTLLWNLALPGGKAAPHIRLVPDNPIDLFDRESVSDECRANDARRNGTHDEVQTTRGIVETFLGSTIDLDTHPRDLSTGQQRALAIALQLKSKPEYLLIDEPTRGLDHRARLELAGLLARVSARGTRVLVATHDRAFARLVNANLITMPSDQPSSGPAFFAAAFASHDLADHREVVAP